MKIGIYTREKENGLAMQTLAQLAEHIECKQMELFIHDSVELPSDFKYSFSTFNSFSSTDSILLDLLITIGGDGTILDTVSIVRDSGIPVLGVNTGRLGFLAATLPARAIASLDSFFKGAYYVDSRTLIGLETSQGLFKYNFALNDFVIHKRDTSSMITIHAYLNGEYFSSYWADGLICSTPSGSTGYNLSCGGPILFPKSSSFVITPIAPHNLNVRPFVIPDDHVLAFEIEGRSPAYLASLDARSVTITPNVQMAIRKAPFFFNLIRLKGDNFIKTLKDKMMWGIDSRN
jgi:NAD+ kinase